VLTPALVLTAGLAVLTGLVEDPSGAPVPGAEVILHPPGRRAATDLAGSFRFETLDAGRYEVEVRHPHFRIARMRVELGPGTRRSLRIVLRLAELRQELRISDRAEPINANPAENPDTVRLSPSLLRGLPVLDLDVLGAAALLLDPAQTGSGGYRLVVDGMETNRVGVTASAIREVRINQNPYSAEFSAPGRGRLEVITAKGESSLHGELNLLVRDHRLDARNAFALERPRQQRRTVEGNLTGPLGRGRRWTFLMSGSREADDQQSIVYALTPAGLRRQQVPRLERDAEINLRLNYQPDGKRWFAWRYEREGDSTRGDDVGGFDLPEVATDSADREQALYFNLQQVHGPRWLHQLQARLRREREQSLSRRPGIARIVVEDAFTGGGAQRQELLRRTGAELHDVWSSSSRRHWLKAGWSLAEVGRMEYRNENNREGTFRFASLEDYLAGRPYAFTVQAGEGRTRYSGYRAAWFVQEDFRWRPNLSLGAGLRYERMAWPRDGNNLAPRISLAWAPGRRPRTVLRAGAGIFFDRLDAEAVREAKLLDGVKLRQILILSPGYPDPRAVGATELAEAPNLVRLAGDLRAPYLVQYSAGINRQVWGRTTLSVSWTGLRGVKQFRARDWNAPTPPEFRRPDPGLATVRVIESSARLSGQSLEAGLRGSITRFFEGAVLHTLGRTFNDTRGPLALPANSLDLSGEWSRADFDRRHRFHVVGKAKAASWFELGVVLRLESGTPYDLLTGRDENRDGLTRDRPPGVRRNSLEGPGLAVLDLRWSREWEAADKVKIGVTVDAFNALNRVNYTRLVGNLSSPFFGQPVGARPARRMQLGLSVEF